MRVNRTTLFFETRAWIVPRMQQFNPYLTQELERMRYEGIHAELKRERFLAEHGLDLWSVLRRSVTSRLPLRRKTRSIEPARAASPVRARHRPLPRRPDLI